MNITTYPLGEMKANCYLIDDGEKCILIDPADSADFLLEQISRKKLDLVGLIATHGHFDHVMAVGEIQLSYPEVPFHVHTKDGFLLMRVAESARHFLENHPLVIPIKLKTKLEKGKMNIGGLIFEVLHTPGHTPGSCCLSFKSKKVIFTGDTLFKGGIGRSDFKYSDKAALQASIKKILSFPEETILYPGHGEETTVEEEKKTIEGSTLQFS